MNQERCDSILMELLQESRNIVGFLDSVFGFLARRTDFYYIMGKDDDNIGFPPGASENLVLRVLRKYDKRYQCTELNNTEESVSTLPPVAREITIDYESEEIKHEESGSCTTGYTPPFQTIEYYNGSVFDNYCWSQTVNDLEFHMLLPKDITTPKELNVRIDSDYLKIIRKRHPESILLEGKLSRKCKNTDAVWSISEGKLQISLDKVQGAWWDRFFETEAALDISKIDCSHAMEELPEESQMFLNQIRWDQQQKLLGLPTSEEIKNREILRAAWDAEGSPFKGQPFDPTIIKFN